MHELAITQNILEIALRHAQERRATRISELYLVIGQWASVLDDSVQFYWDIVSDGTIAKGATLHFSRIAAQMHCSDCNRDYAPAAEGLFCPTCHGQHTKIIHGDEFYLESIEIDTPDHPTGGPK